MSNATDAPVSGQESPPQFLDIAGYRASGAYATLPGRVLSKPGEELDRLSLEKLWHTGFDVASLDEAHEKWKISPLRSTNDIWGILGHQKCPLNAHGKPRFDESTLTSLAIQYPSLLDKGEVYPHTKIIRIRYPQPVFTIRGKNQKGGPGVEQRKYDQPLNQSDERSISEPYFLFSTLQHERLYDTSLPLLMTEGELKGAALGLAGFAAIAWGGVNMWAAPKKSGKNRLHPAIDPEGPCKSWAIPVLGRSIYLIPDIDFRTNQNVRKAFTALGQALVTAGAENVRMVLIPEPPRPDQWKGVDDYITAQVGSRWGGDEQRTAQTFDIIENLLKHHSVPVRQSGRYQATSVVRGAERLYDMLSVPERYTAVLTGTTYEGGSRIGWLTYADDRYNLHKVDQTVGNTSGKVPVPDVELQKLSEEVYEMGVDIALAEGDITERPTEMPTDWPNHLLAAVNRRLPERRNDTLVEPFPGVGPGDFCVRTDRALINITKFFDTYGQWDQRDHWLLPPNPRWFGTGCMNVSLANLTKRPECPIFMDMIHHGFDNDRQSIETLQLYFGKVLTSPLFMGLQQFLSLCGEAGGGKGTISRVLMKILGPQNVALLRSQFAGRFDTANLPGKRLIIFQETPGTEAGSNEQFSSYMAEIVKNVTGQDPVIYERKGHDAKAVNVEADVLTIGNDPPIIPMNAGAFLRRVVLLRVFKTLKERNFKTEMRMMAEELPGIFMWGLEGALRLHLGAAFVTPDRNRDDLEDVTSLVAPEERYVATQFKVVPLADAAKHKLSNETIYDHYQNWVRQHHGRVQQITLRKLGMLLRQRFPDVKMQVQNERGRSIRCYVGLAFINPLY